MNCSSIISKLLFFDCLKICLRKCSPFTFSMFKFQFLFWSPYADNYNHCLVSHHNGSVCVYPCMCHIYLDPNSVIIIIQVTEILDKSTIWKDYKDQRHDLFISDTSIAGYLTGELVICGINNCLLSSIKKFYYLWNEASKLQYQNKLN